MRSLAVPGEVGRARHKLWPLFCWQGLEVREQNLFGVGGLGVGIMCNYVLINLFGDFQAFFFFLMWRKFAFKYKLMTNQKCQCQMV